MQDICGGNIQGKLKRSTLLDRSFVHFLSALRIRITLMRKSGLCMYCQLDCLHVSRPACLPACLPACQPACLPVCLPWLLKCMHACPPVCLPWLFRCMPAYLFGSACLLACMSVCLSVCLSFYYREQIEKKLVIPLDPPPSSPLHTPFSPFTPFPLPPFPPPFPANSDRVSWVSPPQHTE